MKITVETKDEIRNDGLGDYETIDGVDVYTIKETGNEYYNALIFLHEFVEFTLCKKAGISEPLINEWDANHLESEDPAMEEGSPYKSQHVFSENIERLMCKELNLDWNKYEQFVMNLMK